MLPPVLEIFTCGMLGGPECAVTNPVAPHSGSELASSRTPIWPADSTRHPGVVSPPPEVMLLVLSKDTESGRGR